MGKQTQPEGRVQGLEIDMMDDSSCVESMRCGMSEEGIIGVWGESRVWVSFMAVGAENHGVKHSRKREDGKRV